MTLKENGHKILLKLIRENIVVDIIEPNMYSEGDHLRFEINSSMCSYPTLSLKSGDQEVNAVFMNYAKKDIIQIFTDHSDTDNYKLIFEGEFLSKEIHQNFKPATLELNIESIHSFYRLSLYELSSEQNYNNVSFKDFVKDILKIADINTEVCIDPEIAGITIYGTSSNTNLFRIFKEVCLILDATIRFNSDNTVDIKSRDSSLSEFRNQEVVTINKEDINSFTSFDNVLK